MQVLTAVLLISVVAISATACGGGAKNPATPSPSVPPSGTVTGLTRVNQLDDMITLLLGTDAAALSTGAQFRAVPCQANAPSLSGSLDPQCAAGVAPGTLIDAFLVAACEGFYLSTRLDLQQAIDNTLRQGSPHSVYAVVKGGVIDSETGSTDPAVAYTVVLSDGSRGRADAMGTLWMITDQSNLAGFFTRCGQSAALLVEKDFGSRPTFVFGPVGGVPTPATTSAP